MQIVDSDAGLLTNYEVFSLLSKPSHGSHFKSYEAYQQEFKQTKTKLTAAQRYIGDDQSKAVLDALHRKHQKLKPLSDFAWLSSEVQDYLKTTPAAHQTGEQIQSFLHKIQPFQSKLSRKEVLQLINLRPTSMVEIHKVIEDVEERLGEDTLVIQELVTDAFPLPEVEESEEPQ
eukprot:gb/GEZN01015395.1/.p1 GENE.gb/GEZN01015395.1/~~gb/GEZN01015395.1/.p1  ORF type:complete len:174 (+),score=39.62 gb/GEZN01015395.1/:243-764(+)